LLVCFKAIKIRKTNASVITLALTLILLCKTISLLMFLSLGIVFKVTFSEFIIFSSFYIAFSAIFTKKKKMFIATF